MRQPGDFERGICEIRPVDEFSKSRFARASGMTLPGASMPSAAWTPAVLAVPPYSERNTPAVFAPFDPTTRQFDAARVQEEPRAI
jgi:hypothetical protein